MQTRDAVLDCASGTGDLAIAFKKVVNHGRVVASDFCEAMLEHIPTKAQKAGVELEVAVDDVTQLPYQDQEFDLCTIGFGIRNVSDPVKAMSEMARVTKTGGKVLVLETGEMNHPVLTPFYNLYTKNVLPMLGGMMTGQKQAYEYLQNSSSKFPSQDRFIDLMEQTGRLQNAKYEKFLGGATYIYYATVK